MVRTGRWGWVAFLALAVVLAPAGSGYGGEVTSVGVEPTARPAEADRTDGESRGLPDGRLAATGPGSVLVAQAGGPPTAAGAGWQFTFAPLYLWAASTDAKLTVGRLSRSTEIDFKDIVENLDFTFSGHFEATRRDWTAFLDLLYLEVGKGETVDRVRVDVDIQQLFFEFGGTYRLGTVPVGQAGRLTFEALAGGRLIWLDVDLKIAGERASKEAGLIDPMLGGRVAYHITDTVSLWLRGDIAGFGISDSQTKFTWNLVTGVNWRFRSNASVFAGWRFMDIDLEKGSGPRKLDVNLQLSGPVLGFNLYF